MNAPETFPRELLNRPPMERQRYFERECIIEHIHLVDTCDQVRRLMCLSGPEGVYIRQGTMILVIGPTRVGKTTFIHSLETQLRILFHHRLQLQPDFIPFASITVGGSENGRFDWQEYYTAVLRSLQDPFVGVPRRPRSVRDLREAMMEAVRQRQSVAIIVDEAQHLAKQGSGRRLQDQLDLLKHIENVTGVSHVLVGTYDLRPFRAVNAQLGCRSVDVHFRRYDARRSEERRAFQSVLWAFQRLIPLPEEPSLLDRHWEYLYARSLGCVGLLKLHLDRALALALESGSSTMTLTHLRQSELPFERVQIALHAILEGEADLASPDHAEERLEEQVGVAGPHRVQDTRRSHPFERNPERDRLEGKDE